VDKIMSLLIMARSGLGFSFGVGAWTEIVCYRGSGAGLADPATAGPMF